MNLHISKDKHDEFELEVSRLKFVSKTLIILAFPTISYFMVWNYFLKRYDIEFFLALMLMILISLSITLYLSIEEKKGFMILRILSSSFVFVLGIYLIYAISVEKTVIKIHWSYIYPMLVFFALGVKEGFFLISIFYCAMAVSLFYSDFGSIPLEELKIRFLISLLIVAIMSFLSRYTARRDQRKLLWNQRLLKKEIREREGTEEALQKSEVAAKELAQEKAIMAEIGRIISSTLDIEEVYEKFAEEVKKLIPFDHIVINLINFQNNTLSIAYAAGVDIPFRRPGEVVPLIGSGTEECVQGRSGLLIQAENIEELTIRFPGLLPSFQSGLRSIIFVPLISQDKFIGTLSLRSRKLNAYTNQDLKLAESIGIQIAGAIANAQLFAERKRAEEALQDNLKLIGRAKREWESTADSLPQLICLLDRQGFILRANRTLEKWNLGQVNNVKGRRIHELIHPACNDSTCYLEAFWPEAWESLPQGQSAECEAEDRGVKRYLRIQVNSVFSKTYCRGEETESFAVVVISDITERKRAEESLRESEGYLKTLLDSIHAGIMVIDAETHQIIDANSFALKMIGKDKEHIWGRICEGYVCTAEKGNCPITDLQQTVDGSEQILIKANGDQLPILKSVVPIMRKDRKYLIESFIDITKRKQVEKEKAALEEQLLQSQKMEAIGRLAGGVAHDFNNLLTPITGYSQLAISSLSPSDPMRSDLQEIQKAAERAATLTRQLLVFSRRQSLKPQVLNLNSIILDIGKMLHRLIGEQIELVTLPIPELGSVKVDPGQFEQVIVNLAVNARDAMPNGGKLILETTNVTLGEDYAYQHTGITPGDYIMFAVSDTGTGITDEVKAHFFEPFFTTKEKGKGTGLGLSMVYGIVKQSNGHILVYSEPGQGTTFKIYFPRVEEEMVSIPQRDDLGYMPKGNETVLLVEDEPLVRGLAIRVLREQGYNLLEAANGMEALSVAQEHANEKIHLLLTDVIMPQLGGKELADRLKTHRPGIKVLFTSGYTDQAIVQRGLLNLDFAFLEKPFSPSGLVRKVREVLDR